MRLFHGPPKKVILANFGGLTPDQEAFGGLRASKGCEAHDAHVWCMSLRDVASVVSIGESVPQMKDAMAHGSDPEILVDCFGTHRRSPTVEASPVLI